MRSSPGSRLLSLTKLRVAPLVEHVLRKTIPDALARLPARFDGLLVGVPARLDGLLARVPAPINARVQRMGAQTLNRVVERFPALGELLQGARGRVERARAAQQRQAQPSEHRYQAQEAPPVAMQTRAPSVEAPHEIDGAQLPNYDFLLQSLRDSDWKIRADAAQQLGGAYREGVEDALHSALRDDSAEVAAAAAVSLSRHGSTRAISALREVLENREGYFSPVTRAACVHGLARCVNNSDAQTVLDVVQDVDAEVSIAAILAISERLPELATTRLISVLSDENSYFLPLVRLAAANALSRLGTLSPDTANVLLRKETDGEVRRVLEQAH